jgi:intracellular proteinase inhibitor BsuPI
MRAARVVAALCVLTLSCRGGPGTGPIASTGALVLNVALSYSGIYPGEETLIVMTLINRNTSPITLRFNTSCHVLYYIEDPQGNVVVPNTGTWSCIPSVSQQQLAAHQATVSSATFTAQSTGADGTPVPFPPGVYNVYATYAPNPDVRSARVALTVHPAP